MLPPPNPPAQRNGSESSALRNPFTSTNKPAAFTRTPSNAAAFTIPRQARQVNIESGMDGYFPYDPYDLPRSDKWIRGIYREWEEVAGEGEDEDEENEELGMDTGTEEDTDDQELEDEGGVEAVGSVGNGWLMAGGRNGKKGKEGRWADGGLSTSLEGMSISISPVGRIRG
jgi:RNA polymerase I-specific transcription initiation factor RRN3